ncbi:indolepyruvate ferredoxin oxidoreductase family protein [Yinghuangia sp. ASG 101]|uniref:indolepyruvate ferredoxin oxidoreductase family protein n=1 Tax=Yinghuangia sp. ASG 101 TaxID=2896848 RepID=UPI001E46A1DB|nr:indolepyruvate ferredoxin oxidoreductase family protein [Yinghuangia sp. ASG 101]UGQ12460.1 indolepyruvate ferredoxin oxidoreductase family protein [Yinghuangia sp. ASG 101]
MTVPQQAPRSEALLSGVDTLVRLLVLREQVDARAGLTTAAMVSGYPGSPLGGFDLAAERAGDLLAQHRVLHRPGLNEELAAAVVWGSQMGAIVPYAEVDGVVGAWYGKTPGLDRCGDVLKHANALGSGPHGGAVVFCGDDPGAKSSTLACDSQYTFADACVPVLYPGDQQDVLDLGVHAFRMSRFSGAWVGLKVVTAVADGIGGVDLAPERHDPADPPLVDGVAWRHRPQPGIGPHAVPEQEELVLRERLSAARAYARHNGLDRVVGAESGARLGVVCAGKTYFDVVQAFADLGVDDLAAAGIRILRLGMTYPLVEDTVVEFAASVEEIVVIEEKRPFIEGQLRGILHEAGSRVGVVGKRDRERRELTPYSGELNATKIAAVLSRVLPGLRDRPAAAPAPRMLPLLPLPARAPGYCSGCPHNRSTVAPDGALVGGGVGCHGIMYFEARHQGLKSLPPTPMGAEGVPWIGLAPFAAEPHLIQNIGDGTLSHSGTLAIRASVAAGVDVTFKILYNTAVAMTGGQDVTGLMDVPAMTRALEAEGVRRIVVCAEDPRRYGRRARWAQGVRVLGRDELDAVQEELRTVPGVTVIVYDQRCAAEARRLRKRGELETRPRRVVINEAVCEGCGDCGAKSNCLSVLPTPTEFGDKRRIHDPSCNRDYTCLDGDCPSFVTITPKAGRPGRRSAPDDASPARPVLPEGDLPLPELPVIDRHFTVYFTGIGGTGVVTANRILATAAESAGHAVGGLDQTGLSQKAGAVVSHLHIATDRDALGPAAVGPGHADVYLSGDILQAANPTHLAAVSPGRTIAVVGTDITPTAAMLQSDAPAPGPDLLRAAITEHVGAEHTLFVDGRRIAEAVFADHLLGNIVLLGAAFQRGALPLSAGDIDAAMRGRGKAADRNREAFAWGRWAVHDPEAVDARLAAAARPGGLFDPSPAALATAAELVWDHNLPTDLLPLLTRRAAQAVDYQNAAYARRFLGLVERTARRDDAAQNWELTRTVAESWFRLLTYKDEYEVARLHLKADHRHTARELGIDGPYTVTYHLHPPILRRLGMTRKLPMGRPYELAFHALRGMRRLRGTPLDVFGRDRDRRMERAVIAEYEQLVTASLLPRLSSTPYDDAVRLAASALEIKGYGPIKEESVARWRRRVAELTRPRPTTAGEAPAMGGVVP